MNMEKPHCFNTSSGLLRQKRARRTGYLFPGGASPDVTHHSSDPCAVRCPRIINLDLLTSAFSTKFLVDHSTPAPHICFVIEVIHPGIAGNTALRISVVVCVGVPHTEEEILA